jgi:curved DNA-binding protein CbpA
VKADGTAKTADEIERETIEARLAALRDTVEGEGPTLEPIANSNNTNSTGTATSGADADVPPSAVRSSSSSAASSSDASSRTTTASDTSNAAPKSSDTLLLSLLCLSPTQIIDSVIEASTEVDGGAHFSVLCLAKPVKDPVTLQAIVSFDEATIARHHKKMLLATHPDKNRQNPKATLALAAVTKAYSVLGNADLRHDYIKKYVELLPVPPANGQTAGDKSWRPNSVGLVRDAELEVARRKQLDAHRDLQIAKYEQKIMEKLKARTTTTKEAAAAAAGGDDSVDSSGKRKRPESFTGFIPKSTATVAADSDTKSKQQKTSAGSDVKSSSNSAAATAAKPKAAVAAAHKSESDSDSDDDRLAAYQAKKKKIGSSRLF